MKRSLVAVIFLACFLPAAGLSTTRSGDSANEALASLERKTVLLNFVNGLHLTLDQVDSLYKIGCEAESLRAHFARRTRTARWQLEQALLALHPFLMHEQAIPDSLKRAVHRGKATLDANQSELKAALMRLSERSVAVLTPNQLYLVSHFKACLIPPSAGAIGQDRSPVPEHLERTFRRLREVPEWRYPTLKRRVIEAELNREGKKGLLRSTATAETRRRSLEVLVDSVRNMPEPKFLQKLPAVVERFRTPPVAEKKSVSAEARAGRFLLDPQILPILRSKKTLLAEQLRGMDTRGGQ